MHIDGLRNFRSCNEAEEYARRFCEAVGRDM